MSCDIRTLAHDIYSRRPIVSATVLAWCNKHNRMVAFEYDGALQSVTPGGFPCRQCHAWLDKPGVCGFCGAT